MNKLKIDKLEKSAIEYRLKKNPELRPQIYVPMILQDGTILENIFDTEIVYNDIEHYSTVKNIRQGYDKIISITLDYV